MRQSLPASTTPATHLSDLAELLPSWQRVLRAERKARTAGVRAYLGWGENAGAPAELTKAAVHDFVADLLDGGAEAATAHARLKGVRRFSAWLTEGRMLVADPLLGMRSRAEVERISNRRRVSPSHIAIYE
jgi:site-specific recombinase XerC